MGISLLFLLRPTDVSIDDAIIRKSLRYLLEATEHIKVVGAVINGFEAVAQTRMYCPDVAVLDLSMPLMDGIEAAGQIREHCPRTRTIIVSMHDTPKYIRRALQVGVGGYVVKASLSKDLVPAIRALHQGGRYFSQKVAAIAKYYLAQEIQHNGEIKSVLFSTLYVIASFLLA